MEESGKLGSWEQMVWVECPWSNASSGQLFSLNIPDFSLLDGVIPFHKLYIALIPVAHANILSLDSAGGGFQIIFL